MKENIFKGYPMDPPLVTRNDERLKSLGKGNQHNWGYEGSGPLYFSQDLHFYVFPEDYEGQEMKDVQDARERWNAIYQLIQTIPRKRPWVITQSALIRFVDFYLSCDDVLLEQFYDGHLWEFFLSREPELRNIQP
jgi:hypothetical protein